MKIEAGKYYKTRDGQVVGPMSVWDGDKFDCEIDGFIGQYWHQSGLRGFSNGKHPLDLIEPAYPEQGAMKEIGAKVGDVVEWEGPAKNTIYHKVKSIDGHNVYLIEDGEDEDKQFKWWDENKHGTWRIISRASDKPTSPVRTVTTTRQEIVPGVYGRVVVERESNGDMVIDARNMQTAEELTAAIATLTEIRDALT